MRPCASAAGAGVHVQTDAWPPNDPNSDLDAAAATGLDLPPPGIVNACRGGPVRLRKEVQAMRNARRLFPGLFRATSRCTDVTGMGGRPGTAHLPALACGTGPSGL
ncbi:hypothetical protein R5H32_04345 [Defluviimonas sp. D31]|uniref:hypothetical protein n=1 Tax=Defluviimonas sp. D31 TaxID=3083253 RepID=UPI00296EFA7E|nr:hypothetical protein [Defluviimonas sp. D31]MDW4548576.1 hypothetical protein [Defluviimonas sp. D31]